MAKLMMTLMLMAALVFVAVPLGGNAAPFLWPKGYVLSNKPTLQQREAVEGTFRVAVDSQGKTIARDNYALGFLDHNNSGKFTLSIVFSPFSSSPKATEIWSANRNRPVGEKATLMRTATAGILALLDSDGTQVWSSGSSVESMELSNGNWNLYNTTNVNVQNLAAYTVWFSWQHPTNTLTIGQFLRSGQKLVSNASPTNPSEGHFSLVAEKGGLVLYNDNLPYWVWAFPGLSYEYIKNPCINSGTLIAQVVYASNLFSLGNIGSASTAGSSRNNSISSCSPTSFSDILPFATFKSADQSSLKFVRLDSDGNLRAYVALPMRGIIGGNPLVWTVDYELFPSCFNCSLPSVCGTYGVCSNGQCSCPAPDVFKMKEAFQPDAGCSPRLPLNLKCKGKQEMVEVKGVDYYPTKYNVVDHKTYTSSSSCNTLCLSNCTCVAAFFRSDSSSSSCFLAFNRLDSLHVVTDVDRRALYSAFLKVQKA